MFLTFPSPRLTFLTLSAITSLPLAVVCSLRYLGFWSTPKYSPLKGCGRLADTHTHTHTHTHREREEKNTKIKQKNKSVICPDLGWVDAHILTRMALALAFLLTSLGTNFSCPGKVHWHTSCLVRLLFFVVTADPDISYTIPKEGEE